MPLIAEDTGYDYSAGTQFQQRALDGVSFAVTPGQMLLVIGSTGSGKSTLLRLLAGLLEPVRGKLTIDGVPLRASSTRGTVGLVFQDAESQLFAETVLDDVSFGPRNLGTDGSRIEAIAREALRAVGLDPSAYGARSPFGLSGGEARRVAIAGVLAMQPRYLLLDEPTAGLDALGRTAVRDAIRGARDGAGVVVVSHSAEEFLGEADAVLMLSDGAVAFSGTAGEVINDPETFSRAGLDAPDILKVLHGAREAGLDIPRFSLNPRCAAEALSRAGGWTP